MEHDARSTQEYEAHVNRLIATLETARTKATHEEIVEALIDALSKTSRLTRQQWYANVATARRAGMSPERIEHDLTLNLAAETASTATDE